MLVALDQAQSRERLHDFLPRCWAIIAASEPQQRETQN